MDIIKNKSLNFKTFLILSFTCCFLINPKKSLAQLCTGSLGDPVVDLTFGAGTATHAGALAAGTTSYTYSTADFPIDGSYTVENSTAGAGNVWWSTTDHTGNAGGYMMVVNASVSKTDYFYKSTVTGLCPGTTYEFAAWVVNLLRSRDISPPDITFKILTTTGTVIGSYDTGTIPLTPSGPVWKQYGFYFTTPTDGSSVIIQMTNNSNGGAPANDLALDDITFRACGPTMVSSFSSASTVTALSSCANVSQTYTLTSNVSPGFNNPVYQWQVSTNAGSTWTNIAGATSTSTTVTLTPSAGTYEYRLVSSEAANAGSTACEVESNVLTLTVTGGATAAFTMSATTCLGAATVFTDASTVSTGTTITKWSWDFGDGQTSTVQSPTHTYAAAGNYIVKLTVTTSTGCTSTSSAQTVHVNAQAAAAFTSSSADCAGRVVTFTDNSTSADGSIAQRIWNYGDGSAAETLTVGGMHTHTFTTAGTYVVTLQVVSSGGCSSTVFSQNVIVHPVPIVDFTLPDVCLSDAYAQFTDATTIADNSSGLTYLWTFGDPNATIANPNTSTAQNPKHKYSAIGNYTVTLTVTSLYGCAGTTKSKTFTVNGANPVAGFTVENSSNLCSSDDVIFDNTSTVDFGSITKIVFYYDYNNNPNDAITYSKDSGQIPSDGKFTHNYGSFNTPVTKSYLVRMVVYSGGSCSNTYDHSITINANPTVTVSSIGPLCLDAAAVQIATDLNGFTGAGVFSGTGVSSTGLFDPSKSGVGTFTISYLFTAQSGCTYSNSQQVTVYADPTVTAPAEVTVLEGGETTIGAKATGDGLTYLWTPAAGLSSATVLDPIVNPSENTTYQLTVTSVNGCTAAAKVFVSFLKKPEIPNTFTPNGDHVNDTWEIKYLDSYPNCTVEIFNRYGEKLYSTTNYPTPWDGTYKGSPLPVGVYYYIINPKNGRSVISGSLTIIR